MTTITIDRELLEQALEALNKVQWPSRQTTDAIEAIRARLAHTEGKSATAPAPSTSAAVGKLCKELREDLDYAWSWHCNIAMTAFDAGCPHDVANEGAARFLDLLVGVDTRKHPAFQGTQDHPMRNAATAPDELERLRKDAERYQWLAEYLVSDDESYDDAIVAATTVKEVDSVIDNAMKGTS